MPPSLTDHTFCSGLELLNCELLANSAVVADVQVLDRSQNTVMSFITKGRHGLKL
jgi:hypothetical protein